MTSPAERARERARTWTAAVVVAGTPKPPAYADLTAEERLAAFVELNRRVWETVSGGEPPRTPRAEWPGEILDLHRA